jgi:hypothetical protein
VHQTLDQRRDQEQQDAGADQCPEASLSNVATRFYFSGYLKWGHAWVLDFHRGYI